MGLHLLPLPTPSMSATTLVTGHHESKHSLRTLLRTTDHPDDDNKSKAGFTFNNDDDENKPPMAFADDLFCNGLIVPLRPSSLKLPPRLQALNNGGGSPRSHPTASLPKSPRKVRGLKKGKDFDPFMAAVERIRKEDASLKPFYWRQLERSFSESFGRVYGDEWEEIEWDLVGGDEVEVDAGRRSNSFYCRLKMIEERSCKEGRQNWKLLSCFLR